jgi:ubiquitin related modifier 1
MSPDATSPEAIPLKVEFTGGLELLFSNQRSHKVSIPAKIPSTDNDSKPADITYLLQYLRDNLLRERVELFMEGNTM